MPSPGAFSRTPTASRCPCLHSCLPVALALLRGLYLQRADPGQDTAQPPLRSLPPELPGLLTVLPWGMPAPLPAGPEPPLCLC